MTTAAKAATLAKLGWEPKVGDRVRVLPSDDAPVAWEGHVRAVYEGRRTGIQSVLVQPDSKEHLGSFIHFSQLAPIREKQ